MNVFKELHPSLQETLITGLGWDMLRPVQEKSCEAVSAGCDIIILAPTAGGKTEAAFLPILDAILKRPTGHLSAVYLSPLKALINDQTDRIIDLGQRAGLETAVQHGDVSASDRWNFSESEPDILLTTPESLEVLLSSPDSCDAFTHLRFIIVDEIHAFVESSRGVHIKCLIDRLTHISENNPQRIGLSATVGNPEYLLEWFSAPDRKKTLVSVPAPPSKKHFTFILERNFHAAAEKTAEAVKGKKSLIFVDSRNFAERLYQPLSELLPQVYLHHSAVSSSERKEAETAFSSDGGTCVICTSTMELGIDIGNLDLVVNYGPPLSVSSFLQRLGRTGRRGNPAEMVFILKDSCELLLTAAVIEAGAAHKSECLAPPKYPYDVLIQQLFLLIKNRRAVSESALISALQSLSPFSDISHAKLRYLLQYLTDTGYLFRDGNLILTGTRAETEFGHANWKTLLSVLSDSGGYTAVLPDGTVVGTLDPRFVAGDAGKVFSFTGKTWRLLFRDDVHRRALIEPSDISRGLKHPFWGGAGGSARVSRLAAESAGDIISRGRSVLPLPSDVREALDDLLTSLPRGIRPGKIHLRVEPEVETWDVVISTFAGEEINRVLTILLKNRLMHRLEFRATPFAVRVSGFSAKETCDAASQALYEIAVTSPAVLSDELPMIPDGAIKFSPVLPPDMKKEMGVIYYKLDELLMLLSDSLLRPDSLQS